jgi:hypothetical protein
MPDNYSPVIWIGTVLALNFKGIFLRCRYAHWTKIVRAKSLPRVFRLLSLMTKDWEHRVDYLGWDH